MHDDRASSREQGECLGWPELFTLAHHQDHVPRTPTNLSLGRALGSISRRSLDPCEAKERECPHLNVICILQTEGTVGQTEFLCGG